MPQGSDEQFLLDAEEYPELKNTFHYQIIMLRLTVIDLIIIIGREIKNLVKGIFTYLLHLRRS
jgi:hypothetical protein